MLVSLVDSFGHYCKNVNCYDKEIGDNNHNTRKLFFRSDDTNTKSKMNRAILESFVNFYKNHLKSISLSFFF